MSIFESTIEIKNISKNFGSTRALKNVTMTLMPNKIYGILGRNGAGKSTLLNIIANMLFPSDGEVLIDGEPVIENDGALAKIFYTADKNLFPEGMKVKEGLRWAKEFRPAFDTEYANSLLKKFNLDPHKKIDGLSTGYQTIFRLILTLSSGAPVILFDEPVLGLDANHRELFYKEVIKHYSENPKTIVLSTHLIDEVSDILEDIVIIKEGEILLEQPVEEVLQMAYTVSGDVDNVDRYTEGKNVIHTEVIGRLKASTVFQKRDSVDRESLERLGLQVAPARLQELFVCLTNS